MRKIADLEIGLQYRDEGSYAVDIRFTDPDSEADNRLGPGKKTYAVFDFKALGELLDDPDQYGEKLTAGLFSDPDVRIAFQNACARVGDEEKLRIRLTIDESARELRNIRWETLKDPRDGISLCTNENLLFSRYLSSFDWRPITLRPKGRLRALVVIANPSDLANHKFSPIDVAGELERVKKALGEIPMTILPEPNSNKRATLGNLIGALRDQEFDILYLVAHGALKKIDLGKEIKYEPRLWLEDDEGKTQNVSGIELSIRLKELSQRPRLAVIASCESAGDSEGDALSALGPRMAEAGIPAILAMQGKISMETVAKFMPVFFKELEKDGSVDRALAVARGTVRERPDYWMPVLFMRLKNGRIWYVPGFSEGKEFTKWPALISYIKNKKCTAIIGPGLFEPLFGSLSDIAQRWSEEFRYPLAPTDRESLPRVAQYLTINQSPDFPYQHYTEFLRKEIVQRYRGDLPARLLEHLGEANPDELIEAIGVKRRERTSDDAYKLLAQLPIEVFITTNLNSMLESALREAQKEPQVILSPWNEYTEERIVQLDPNYKPSKDQPLVYYLFGRLAEPDSVVLTEDSYFDFLLGISRNNDLIPEYLKDILSASSLLFIGFKMDEWNFRVLFRSIINKQTERARRYVHIAAQVEPEEGRTIDPDAARGYLEDYFNDSAKINLYWGSAEEFVRELWKQWNQWPQSP